MNRLNIGDYVSTYTIPKAIVLAINNDLVTLKVIEASDYGTLAPVQETVSRHLDFIRKIEPEDLI